MPSSAFLFSPLPDETVHSWVSRLHLLSGDRCGSDTLRRCVDDRHAILATALPTRLAELGNRLGCEADRKSGSPNITRLYRTTGLASQGRRQPSSLGPC